MKSRAKTSRQCNRGGGGGGGSGSFDVIRKATEKKPAKAGHSQWTRELRRGEGMERLGEGPWVSPGLSTESPFLLK